SPVHDDWGRIVNFVGVQNDVTERKRAEEGLRHAHAELDERVRNRTARLAEANALLRREIAERRELEEQLTHQAFHDPLTGLPNRPLFLDRLEFSLSASLGRGTRVAALLLDLDDFRAINESLGYEAGDSLLLAVAERLENTGGGGGRPPISGEISSPCCSRTSRVRARRYGSPSGSRKTCAGRLTFWGSSGW
nr:diguanylate cyclase [Rubrobacter sp.]